MTFTSPSATNSNNIFHIRAIDRAVNFTTGLLKNPLVEGVRSTVTVAVLIDNGTMLEVTVQILGYYLSGTTKVLYVLELFDLNPGQVATRNYYAQFDAFKFQFKTSSPGVEISLWGEDPAGNLVAAHRVLPAELSLLFLPN